MALHIETAIDPNAPYLQKSIALTNIQSGILALRQAQGYLLGTQWALQLFEWITAHKGILPGHVVPEHPATTLEQDPPSNLFGSRNTEKCPNDNIVFTDELLETFVKDSCEWVDDLIAFGFIDCVENPGWET